MRPFFCTLVLLLIIPFVGFGQIAAPPVGGGRGMAMGQTGLTFRDGHALFTNQAGLGFLEEATAVAFGEQRFLLEELGSYSLGAALPVGKGALGLSLNHFGFEGYNEQRIGLAYGRQLAEGLSIGAKFIALHTQIPEYGNTWGLTVEAGLQYQLLPEVSVGFHLANPARVETAPGTALPTLLRLGFQYAPSQQLKILAEVEKDIDFTARFRAGAEYQAAEAVHIRLGAATQPAEASLGLGFALWEGMKFDVAARYHQALGITPGAGLHYRF